MNNQKILITKPLIRADVSFLENQNIDFDIIPALIYSDEKNETRVSECINLNSRNWIFTSNRAVLAIHKYLLKYDRKTEINIFVVGEKSKDELINMGFTNVQSSNNIDEIIFKIDLLPTDSIVYFKGNNSRKNLPDYLMASKHEFKSIEVYQTKQTFPILKNKDYRAILYFSPLSVESILKNNISVKNILAIAVGETTETSLKDNNFTKIIVANETHLKSMVEGLKVTN